MKPGERRRRGEGGFTFVEIMVALLVTALVVAGLFQAFNTIHKWWIGAGVKTDQRQNARAGLETLTRDLEMAGYQTTTYGDQYKRGIAFTFVSAHEIEMDQQRPTNETIGSATPTYQPSIVYYHLATDTRTGQQNLYRQIRAQPGVPAPDEIVAERVSNLAFAYFDENNGPVAGLPPAAPNGSAAYIPGAPVPAGSPLRAIRRIQVTLSTTTARSLPIGPETKDFTLTASVTPQNLVATDEVTADLTPPAVPASPVVWDTRVCGDKLRLRWSAGTEPDLDGYYVYYGTRRVRVPLGALNPQHPEYTLNPADLLVTRHAVRDTAPNTYSIRLSAYDSSGNESAPSAAVAANPNPDVDAYDANNVDTTFNPGKPAPPTGLVVTAGGADGQLVVTWQAPGDGSATAGFRLYRSTAAFAGGHVDEALLVRDEAALGPETTTWTDTGLTACTTYHYALASVNCDETLVATYAHDAGNPSAGDYAVASGEWRDTAPPPPPVLVGSEPEEQRLPLTLTNPLSADCPDFARTELFWSKGAASPPQVDGAGVVTGGAHVPENDGGSDGVFTKRGSQTLVFDTEGVTPPPSLEGGVPYHLLALSYDACGNASTPVATTLTPLAPPTCVDVAPGSFSNATITSCQADAATLGWSYPDRATITDHEGFRVWRPHPTDELTTEPTAATTWTDAGPLDAGGEYAYTVEATDCSWERHLADPTFPLPTVAVDGYDYVYPPRLTFTVLPGGLQRYAPGGGLLVSMVSTAADVAYPDTIIPINAATLSRTFLSSGELSIGCQRVTYTGISYSGATPVAFTGCSWPASATGLSVPVGTTVSQYDWASYAAPENFVATLSDASQPYTYHNNVRFSLQNTSRSPVRLKKVKVEWDNPNVVLSAISVGGAPSTTAQQTIGAAGVPSGNEVTVGVDVEDIASGLGSPSGPVPVVLRFANTDGTVNRLTDMRGDTLTLSLWVWNKSFDDAECAPSQRLTVFVPRGPVLGGFAQSAPGAYGIDSYEVVGPSATARDTDVRVPYGVGVNVFGTALDASRAIAPDSCNLGFETGYPRLVGISAAPAAAADVPAMPTSGSPFVRPLYGTGGDRYAIRRTAPSVDGALMPQASGEVIWYYAIAVDKTGNWDRVPNPDNGAYAYFQPPFDPCAATPQAPVLSIASSSPTGALLTWTEPTAYEDGVPIVGSDALTYDLYVKAAGGDPWPSTPLAAGLTGTSYSHAADLAAGSFYYMVRAKNSCAHPSPDSNVAAECEGASGWDCSLFTSPASVPYGQPIALAVGDFCTLRDNGVADSVVFRVAGASTTDFTVAENGDTGQFAKTITAVESGGGGDQVAAPAGSLTVTLVAGGTSPCSPLTVTLTGGACNTTPNAPSSLTVTAPGSGAASLTWIKPNFNTDATPVTDLAGYDVASARCTNWSSGNCSSWASWVTQGVANPAAQSYTWSGLVVGSRYKFRVRAKDSCATANASAWTSESTPVRIQ